MHGADFRPPIPGHIRTAILAPCDIPPIPGHIRTAILAPCDIPPIPGHKKAETGVSALGYYLPGSF